MRQQHTKLQNKSFRAQHREKVRGQHLVCDVPAQQDPDGSSPLRALDLQPVLGIVGQAVGILHRALLRVPCTRSDADTSSGEQGTGKTTYHNYSW